jgi:hypothetical protein
MFEQELIGRPNEKKIRLPFESFHEGADMTDGLNTYDPLSCCLFQESGCRQGLAKPPRTSEVPHHFGAEGRDLASFSRQQQRLDQVERHVRTFLRQRQRFGSLFRGAKQFY